MKRNHFSIIAIALVILGWAAQAQAVSSAELYTSESYQYGRFEARIRFAPGSGVVSSFFLWKDGSEIEGTFWNELDFEKLGADCHLDLNALYGDPQRNHTQDVDVDADLCGEFHTYVYEWTPEYVAWFVDDEEVRRETGQTALAFSENTAAGMQIRFNVWPGDASFGGVFDPSILPVYQFVDWVQYSSYDDDGNFTLEWREDFDGSSIPSGWLLGSWASPKNLSTHTSQNVGIIDGYAVLGLTADDAPGIAGASPEGPPLNTSTSGAAPATGSAGGAGGSCRLNSRELSNGGGGLFISVLGLGWYRRRQRAGNRVRPA